MSRHGYVDDMEDALALGRWRAAVNNAIKGKRGQAFLHEMLAALDALPEKKLIAKELVEEDGQVCALGAVAKARALDTSKIEAYDQDGIHTHFGIANAMAREIIWINDEVNGEYIEIEGPPRYRNGRQPRIYLPPTPERRFAEVRAWIVSQIRPA
jgi:hypothetical protein